MSAHVASVKHGHEAVGAEFFYLPVFATVSVFCDAQHLLLFLAKGDDHDAAGFELRHERVGNLACAAGDDDAVVGAVVHFL